MHEGPIDCIEALGWLTCGKEAEDPDAVIRRPKFSHPSVKHLYKIEIPHLFARLQLDNGKTLNRDDTLLFEDELDDLLEGCGPEIWPEIGKGDRSHLRTPDPDTRYPSHLVCPKDSDQIKQHLRKLILVKKARPGVDLNALVEKKGEKRTWRTPKQNAASPMVAQSRRGQAGRPRGSVTKIFASSRNPRLSTNVATNTPTRRSRRGLRSDTSPTANRHSVSDSHEPAVGVRTRSTAAKKSVPTKSPKKPSLRESILRLYSRHASGGTAHGDMVWNGAGTSDELFAQVSQKLGMDVNWLLFNFPEDMFLDDITEEEIPIFRIDRGSRETDPVFELSVRMLREAPDFGFPRRTVEVQCGLEMVSTEGSAH